MSKTIKLTFGLFVYHICCFFFHSVLRMKFVFYNGTFDYKDFICLSHVLIPNFNSIFDNFSVEKTPPMASWVSAFWVTSDVLSDLHVGNGSSYVTTPSYQFAVGKMSK